MAKKANREDELRELLASQVADMEQGPVVMPKELPSGVDGAVRMFYADIEGQSAPDVRTAARRDPVVDRSPSELALGVLVSLTEPQQCVLRIRFGINAGSSDGVPASEESRTRERIRQIEAMALRKLRHPSRVFRPRSTTVDSTETE
ncbi:hypothetical protein COV06_03670 [Candidatus Uhrbacteria bacterium CG10_big_fil_rev_8_21_14_0_10_50_16]|uniref:RNA polymerase sigma-70 region 4 domain-containing protein n=1 Tax=Candidatus Uhrbacteria bacterium CG10_big_fil_rev_8_21_14_0_10_50_16 TaxID=1975039 RepID=A0A2H0RLU8_9BACT|nr:MAG: hypothetical protein COV06_03670 [Candidatus Uhrbacteria bacterium CG10_big_fil_rev_8_21_14_0_10_50_16]